MQELLKVPQKCSLKSNHKSKGKYWNLYNSNFCLLPDGKTLIGGTKLNTLQCEDITRKEIKIVIDQIGSSINTMRFNRKINSLLMGNNKGCVFQYGRESSGYFKKQKEYGNIEVGSIFAIDCSGDFAVVGGRKGIIKLIDMKSRKLLGKGIKTAFKWIEFVQFCRVSKTEMHLAVGGGKKNYSNSKTDLFDVSRVFNLEDNNGGNLKTQKRELIQEIQSILEQINHLKTNLQNHQNLYFQKNQKLNQKIQQLMQIIQTEIQHNSNRESQKNFNQKQQKKHNKNNLKLQSSKSSLKHFDNPPRVYSFLIK